MNKEKMVEVGICVGIILFMTLLSGGCIAYTIITKSSIQPEIEEIRIKEDIHNIQITTTTTMSTSTTTTSSTSTTTTSTTTTTLCGYAGMTSCRGICYGKTKENSMGVCVEYTCSPSVPSGLEDSCGGFALNFCRGEH